MCLFFSSTREIESCRLWVESVIFFTAIKYFFYRLHQWAEFCVVQQACIEHLLPAMSYVRGWRYGGEWDMVPTLYELQLSKETENQTNNSDTVWSQIRWKHALHTYALSALSSVSRPSLVKPGILVSICKEKIRVRVRYWILRAFAIYTSGSQTQMTRSREESQSLVCTSPGDASVQQSLGTTFLRSSISSAKGREIFLNSR